MPSKHFPAAAIILFPAAVYVGDKVPSGGPGNFHQCGTVGRNGGVLAVGTENFGVGRRIVF